MEEIKKHLEESYNSAENSYWNIYSSVEETNRKIKELENNLHCLLTDLAKYDSTRKYYEKLLNEFNELKKLKK